MDNLDNILQQKNPQQVQEIIDAENARLDAKEQSYQNMQYGKQRILQLNQNYQARTSYFNRIMFFVFIFLFLTVVLIYLKSIFPVFDALFSLALVLVISAGAITFVYLYSVFESRNPSNFDEIVYKPPDISMTSAGQAAANTTKPPIVSQSKMACIGPDCCLGEDVVWDAGNGVCTSTDLSGNVVVMGGNVVLSTGNVVAEEGNTSCYSYSGLENTSLYMNVNDAPVIPKLTTGQLFLDTDKKNVIEVEDSKTFNYSILHVETRIFTSLDGVNFINSADSSQTALIVTRGPEGHMKQQINGQGIMITDSSGSSFFYSSKSPPQLIAGDVFLSDSGVVLTVLNSNEITIQVTTNSPILRTYGSVGGVDFVDIENNMNTAKVVTNGPVGAAGEQILGQAILLNEGVYFYYSRNTNSATDNQNVSSITQTFTYAPPAIPASIGNGIPENFEGIQPIQVNQYTVYPGLKNKAQNKYQSMREDTPYSEYKTSTQLFSF